MLQLLQFSHPANVVWFLVLPGLYWLYIKARVHIPRPILWLRLLSIGLLLISLCGPRTLGTRPGTAVVFLLDHSDSVSHTHRAAALAYVNRALKAMPPTNQAALLVFGKNAFIARPFGASGPLATVQTTPSGTRTDIASALRLAMTVLEPYPAKRILLLSDGQQNAGSAVREAQIAAAHSIPIDVVPLGTPDSPSARDVRLEEVTAPSQVRLGEPFHINIFLHSNGLGDVSFTLYRNGAPIAARHEPRTPAGRTVIQVPQRLDTPGFHRYTGVIEASADASMTNNEGGAVVYAEGKPAVLYVHETAAPNGLTDVLTQHDFAVDLASPVSLPITASRLSSYAVVIFDNIPARAVSTQHMHAIADYVEHFGGGFIMTGSTQSFGPGGYTRTPIARILPVDLRARPPEQRPHLGLVLLLDKSGSMAAEHGGQAKLTLAKEATRVLRTVLAPEDSLGIIAFDRQPSVLRPLIRLSHQAVRHAPVGALQARGGTQLYPALALAYQWLHAARLPKKQVLVISDGHTAAADFPALLDNLVAANTAVSVVGIGPDADRAFLTKLATRSGGRTYFSPDMTGLAAILQQEAGLLSGQWIHQRRVKPQAVAAHEMFTGIDVSTIPEIEGYIASTPKPLTTVLLATDRQEPLLACGRFGLGKTLVFTSDLSSVWTAALTAWDAFGPLWTQMVRWTSRRAQSDRLHPHVTMEGDTARLRVEAFEPNGRFLNFLQVRATIVAPDAQTTTVHLEQTASGRYEGSFPVQEPGAYVLTITATEAPGQPQDTLHFGKHLAAAQEHRATRLHLALLRKIARTTHGTLLPSTDYPWRRDTLEPVYVERWHVPTLVALGVFLLEVARRRGWRLSLLLQSSRRGDRGT